ncbi:hypothetical protein SLA2020_339650 [Shorea laevis]
MPRAAPPPKCVEGLKTVDTVSFPPVFGSKGRLRAGQTHGKVHIRSHSSRRLSQLRSLSQILSCSSASGDSETSLTEPRRRSSCWLHRAPERDSDSILSLHTPMHYLEPYRETICDKPLSLPV